MDGDYIPDLVLVVEKRLLIFAAKLFSKILQLQKYKISKHEDLR